MTDLQRLLFAIAEIKELQQQNLDLFDDNAVLAAQNAELAERLKAVLHLSKEERAELKKQEIIASLSDRIADLNLRVRSLKNENEHLICRLAQLHKANPPVQITIQSNLK